MSESTRGVFLHTPYMIALKDAPTAILCSQIHYWYTPSKAGKTKLRKVKEGKLWIVKSAREWSEETGLTRAQVKRGIAVLARLGAIETLVKGFNAAPTGHLRALRVKGNMLKAGEYLIPIAGDSQSQESNPLAIGDESMALHSSPLATDSQSNTVTTQEISTKTTQESLASNDAGLPKAQIPKHPPEKKNKNDEVVGTLEVKEDIPVYISSEPIIATLPREVWNQLTKQYSEQYGEYLPSKAKELAQLNRLFKDLGSRSEPILRLLFLRWNRFSKHAKNSHGAYSIPALPTIDFIVRYSQAALHFWKLNCQESISVLQGNPSSEDCAQLSEQKHSVAAVGQTADSQSIEPQPMAVSCKCSKVVDIEDGHIATLEEIQAYRQLRLANKKAKEELLASNSPPKLISSSLVSPADELLKYGPLAPCPLVPELKSTTTGTVTDATKGDSFGDWEDWGDSEF